MLEGITHVELRYPVSTKLNLRDGEHGIVLPHGCDVTFYVVGEHLIVIANEPDEVTESQQATDVPGDGTD